MQRYCLTLDLVDDPEVIAGYREHHRNVWPEVKQSIIASGICSMAIYLLGNRYGISWTQQFTLLALCRRSIWLSISAFARVCGELALVA